jgi:hypothetical protein
VFSFVRDSSFVIAGVILATVPKKQSETPPPIVPELLPPFEDFRFEYLKLPRANPLFIDLWLLENFAEPSWSDRISESCALKFSVVDEYFSNFLFVAIS